MEKIKVKFVYTFEIKYEHEKHFKQTLKELKKQPIYETFGAGMVDGKVYSYSCERIGGGVESKRRVSLPVHFLA